MFSMPYFRQTMKSNFKFLVGFTVVLCIFLVVICNVFTPDAIKDMQSVTQGSVMEGLVSGGGTLLGFMSSSFYAIMAIIFPMVYSIMVGNRLIAEKVDKGSMAGFLSTPTTRSQISISSAIYFILSLAFMWGFTSVIGIVAANIFQPDALDIPEFLLMNLGAFLFHFAISGICFSASCIMNTSKNSLTFGAGIPILFFVVNLIKKLSTDLDVLKYFTLNTLFDPSKVLEGNGYCYQFLAMGLIGVVLYLLGILVFSKKDLPL